MRITSVNYNIGNFIQKSYYIDKNFKQQCRKEKKRTQKALILIN